jgi:hypothetical protein
MRSKYIKGEAKKYLSPGGTAALEEQAFAREAAEQSQKAAEQAMATQQKGFARMAQAQAGGSPIAPGQLAEGGAAIAKGVGDVAAKATTEGKKLAQAVREKKTAQALGAAERLSAERWERGMDVTKTAAGVAAVGLAAKQGAGEAAKTAATLAAGL